VLLDPVRFSSRNARTTRPFDSAVFGRVARTIGRSDARCINMCDNMNDCIYIFAIGLVFCWVRFLRAGVLTRCCRTADLRAIGSGQQSSPPLLRTGNKGLAAATLIVDMLKGTVAVLSRDLSRPRCALLRHLRPFSATFSSGSISGGKESHYIGLLLDCFWPAAVVFCVLWLATRSDPRLTRHVRIVRDFITPIFFCGVRPPSLASRSPC